MDHPKSTDDSSTSESLLVSHFPKLAASRRLLGLSLVLAEQEESSLVAHVQARIMDTERERERGGRH